MRICKNCQIQYDDSHLYCAKCGTPTEPSLKICSCGYLNDDDAKFCISCGKPFVEETSNTAEENLDLPPVKTVAWWKVLVPFAVAFIVLTAVCFII